jgi:trehalose utilization protein
MDNNRRNFIKAATLTAASGLLSGDLLFGSPGIARSIKVVVWDERQPKQKQAYENFLGNQIADHLRTQPGLSVQSVALDDPEQGLADTTLDNCDVLIWWGHVRHSEVLPETAMKIVKKVLSGSLSFIAIHSAHWSTPFMEAMNEVTRRKAEQSRKAVTQEITYIAPPKPHTAVTFDSRLTPYTDILKFPDGTEKMEVHLPYCVFPLVRNDGKASTVNILKPKHPIVKGIPAQFEIPQTEIYDEPFHVPEPDEVILEERWATGEWFRSGSLWQLGKGKVFYFRPGHETYSIFKQQWPLLILINAVRWMGA